jgi:hypothetical protein
MRLLVLALACGASFLSCVARKPTTLPPSVDIPTLARPKDGPPTAPGPIVALERDGKRLRRTTQPGLMLDVDLGVACSLKQTTANNVQCEPRVPVVQRTRVRYSDPACTKLAIGSPSPPSPVVRLIEGNVGGMGCEPLQYLRLGSERLDSHHYRGARGDCSTERVADPEGNRPVIEKMGPGGLARAHVERRREAEGVATRWAVTDDGGNFFLGTDATSIDAPCGWQQTKPDEARCIPIAQLWSSPRVYLEPSCTGETLAVDECGDSYLRVIAAESEGRERRLFLLGPRVEDAWIEAGQDATCRRSLEASSGLYRNGPAIDLDKMPRAVVRTESNGEINVLVGSALIPLNVNLPRSE